MSADAALQILDHTAGISSKNADTDWLAADFTPTARGSWMEITVVLATGRAIKVVDDQGFALGVFAGAVLTAGQAYTFDLPMVPARTYNLQNVGGAAAITSLLCVERAG